MFKVIRGAKDILPEEATSWQNIEDLARSVFYLYDYKEIRTPLIEDTGLFNRSLGNSSEVVQKQMFEVKRTSLSAGESPGGYDNTGNFVLRPEGTASVVRAYIENALDKKEGFVKFYYIGPMFRAERPQKGRLRQFHHLGVEAIGSLSADLDVEIISLAHRLLKETGVGGFKITLNSLGCQGDKKKLAQYLRTKLKDRLSRLCSDCQDRFDKNVLRILDCKKPECRDTVMHLNLKEDYLCVDCQQHFHKVREGLKSLNIDYQVLPYLVRGLDYYTRTVFEITHKELGSQDALGAGGRYDNLVKELGGPDVGAIGFALGIERILLTKEAEPEDKEKKMVYLISIKEEAKKKALKLLDDLRKSGILADTDYQDRSLKAAMRQANDLGARFVIIIGEDEIKKNTVTLKDMQSGQQREVKQEDIIEEIQSKVIG